MSQQWLVHAKAPFGLQGAPGRRAAEARLQIWQRGRRRVRGGAQCLLQELVRMFRLRSYKAPPALRAAAAPGWARRACCPSQYNRRSRSTAFSTWQAEGPTTQAVIVERPGRSRTASCGRRGGSEVSQVGMRRPCATRCITVNAAAATTIVPLPGCHERMRLGPIRRKDTLNILVRPYRAACRGREKSRGGNEPGLDERLPH